MEGMSASTATAAANPASTPADTSSADTEAASSEGAPESKGDAGSPKSLKQQVRELGEQDLDSVVKLKINGQVKSMSVREAVKLAQLEQAGRGKMEEAAKVRKQAQAMMEFAKANPKEFFKQLGMDPYEFAESTLAERLEMMQLSPEQKRIRELEEKTRRFEDQEKEQRAQAEARRNQETEAKAAEALDKEFTEAFSQASLPKHPFFMQQMAALMLSADNQGDQLTAKQAADMIKGRFNQHTREIFEASDANAIREILGDSVLKKLRQAEVDRITGKTAPTLDSGSRPGQSPQAKPSPNKQKVVTERGWRQYLESLKVSGQE